MGIPVFNEPVHPAAAQAALCLEYPGCIVMSARNPDDVVKLHLAILAFFQKSLVEAELFLPRSAQQLRGEIFSRCQVLEERAEEDGAFFSVRVDQADLDNLREQMARAKQ